MKGYNLSKPAEYKVVTRDDTYVRIHYVRYADNFVMGVEASYNTAKKILQELEEFVNRELKLKFNKDKTSISRISGFRFLGYNIRAPLKGVKPLESVMMNGKMILRRKKTRLVIEMDTAKVLKKLANHGFIRKTTSHLTHNELEYRGTFKGNLINLEHPDILKYYNSVVRGIQNYYSFARNRVAVARVG